MHFGSDTAIEARSRSWVFFSKDTCAGEMRGFEVYLTITRILGGGI
jgi:hypothetical protein